ncbi:hypothetical protein GCM10008905_07800 [Clostridium malenominatum]|uniref:DUF3298 domain-containing protein n=1 Tax=Clostridium malenominatum TaxID=1539 RepID=A0ABP3U0H5_9CLOT
MNKKRFLLGYVRDNLPRGSRVLDIDIEDLDFDGVDEISVRYEYGGDNYILLLKGDNVAPQRLFSAPIKTLKGTMWGYINNKGEFVIKPVYDNAFDFQSNELAIVSKNNYWGIINKQGREVVPFKYDSISEFSEGRAVVIDKEGFKVIDERGTVITNKAYNYIGSYSDGRAVFANANEGGNYIYGYLDLEGKEVIGAKYEEARDFKEGKAIVKIKEGQYALVDRNGNVINTYNHAFVGNLGDGLLPFQNEIAGKYGYIDISGKVVLEPRFSLALPFYRDRAIVNVSEDYINKYGLIDKRGDYIIKPEYNDINDLGEDRYAVGKAIRPEEPFVGSIYAIACVYGKFFTNFIYNTVASYKNGVASASNNSYTFFIDKSGNIARNLPMVKGSGTLEIMDGLIRGIVDYRTIYFTKDGKVIWRQNIIIPLNKQYKVLEEKYKPNKDYLVYYPQVMGMDNKDIEKNANDKLKELSGVKPIDENAQLDYTYFGDFNVEFFKKNLLVLEIVGYLFYFGAAHGMPSKAYPHIDLVTGRFYELKDLFKEGSNYVEVLSKIIGDEIKNNPEYSYVWPDQYKGIKPNQPFYTDEENLYIYFEPYEIAPYAAGFPTFKIPYSKIMYIINTEGEFWRAYN